MPFALLLRDISTTLTTASALCAPWIQLVAMEEALIDRARSVFLVHWFGRGLPMTGLMLRIHIANLAELQGRYDDIQRQQRPERWGMNLATPLAGGAGALGGGLVGAALNPLVLVVGGIWWLAQPSRDPRPLWQRILGAMRSIGLVLLRLVLGPFAIPLGIAAGVQHGGAGRTEDDHVHGVPDRALGQIIDGYQLGGALADLFAALNPFLDQITDPDRRRVRNPLVRAALRIGDALAGLMAQLIGFAAFLVEHIAPMIVPLVEQGIAFLGLFGAVKDMLQYLIADLMAGLRAARPHVTRVVHQLMASCFGILGDAFTELGFVATYLRDQLVAIARDAFREFARALGPRLDWARRRITDHPVMQTITAIPERMRAFGAALDAIWAAYSAKPSGLVSRTLTGALRGAFHLGLGAYRAYRRWRPSTSPPLPGAPVFPDVSAMLDFIGRPAHGLEDLGLSVELAQRQRHGIDAPTRSWTAAGLLPPQLLEDQYRQAMTLAPLLGYPDDAAAILAREAHRQDTGAQLRAARARELPLRDHFTTVLGRLMPGEVRVQMSSLVELFETIDVSVYGRPATRPRDRVFPVLDLPDTGQLLPHAGRLRFRAPEGTNVDEVRGFQERLLARLRAQRYPAPALSPAREAGR